ncbi:F-box protein At5g07610-like [Rutidosis leptorrhynchoides]|uniref:F-box protein At5g07610-like n=1 Tax=Rutidosis leptorrhynchoides TaxID=125765 RepID=UPI003A99AFA2
MPNNPSSSPLHAAYKIGSCNDLTTEIMLQLPVTSLLRFKSVSKHWYSLISNPTFKQLLQNRSPDPPSGLYAMTKTNHYFIPFDVKNRPKAPNITLNFDPDNRGRTHIVHSCNGLMLCCRWYWNDEQKLSTVINRYIYNPTINQFTMLPRHDVFNTHLICGMTLVFDPSKSPYYKVVSVRDSIGIYNSQTYTWKESCRCPLVYDCGRMIHNPGVYWNNSVHWFLHWLHGEHKLLYFSFDEEVVRILHTPFRFATSNIMFESRDHLLVVEMDYDNSSKLKIHELKRDYSEWFVKYHVDLHQLGQSFPGFMSEYIIVLCVVLGEREDESFFVLKNASVTVRFNLSFITARALQVIDVLFWLVVMTVIDVLFYIFEYGYSVLKAAFAIKGSDDQLIHLLGCNCHTLSETVTS